MPPEDDTKRALPSAEEINAYLELSSARTKKRLTLAFGTTGAPRPPAPARKLRVAGAAERTTTVSPIPELVLDVTDAVKKPPEG